jgi:hypothetical protein
VPADPKTATTPAAPDAAAAPAPPGPDDADRYATERRLKIEVVSMPDGRNLRYVSREPDV